MTKTNEKDRPKSNLGPQEQTLVEAVLSKEARQVPPKLSPSLLFLFSETRFAATGAPSLAPEQLPESIDPALLHGVLAKEFNLSKTPGETPVISPAELLLVPVRTLRGVFTWATSIERLRRLQTRVAGAPCAPRWKLPEAPKETALINSRNHCVAKRHIILEQFSYVIEPTPALFPIAAWLADNAFPWSLEYQWWRKKLVNDLVILPEASLLKLLDAALALATPESTVERIFPTESLFYSVLEPTLWERKLERSHLVLPALTVSPEVRPSTHSEPGIFAARLVRHSKRKKRSNKRPGQKPASTGVQAKGTATVPPAGGTQAVGTQAVVTQPVVEPVAESK